MRHFSASVFSLTLSDPSPRDNVRIKSRGQYRKNYDSFTVMTLRTPIERMLGNAERSPCDKVTLSAF
jgi:hypothetical protein